MLEGQKAFLKKLKIKPPDDINRGVAADLIEDARKDTVDLLLACTEAGKPRNKKAGAPAVLLLLLILAGGAAGALHHFGIIDLKDIYAQARSFVVARMAQEDEKETETVSVDQAEPDEVEDTSVSDDVTSALVSEDVDPPSVTPR